MRAVRRIIKIILLLYSIALTTILILGATSFGVSTGNYIVPILSLPIAFYFLFLVINIKRGRKVLFLYSLLISSLMTISGIKQAGSISEYSSILIFLPMTLYFWLQVWPKKKDKKIDKSYEVIDSNYPFGFKVYDQKKEKTEKLKKIEDPYPTEVFGKNFDIDKRMFLKLIGSAGISVFMLAVFTKKAQAAFFGSVPGPGTVAIKDSTGAQVDPAIKHPTDGYKINQIDESSPAYYGFTDKTGAWYIMKEDSSGNYRYVKGASSFPTNWTNRASLSYDYYDVVF